MSKNIGTSIAFKTRECQSCGTPEDRNPKDEVVIDIYLTRMGKRMLCLGCVADRRAKGDPTTRSSIPNREQ